LNDHSLCSVDAKQHFASSADSSLHHRHRSYIYPVSYCRTGSVAPETEHALPSIAAFACLLQFPTGWPYLTLSMNEFKVEPYQRSKLSPRHGRQSGTIAAKYSNGNPTSSVSDEDDSTRSMSCAMRNVARLSRYAPRKMSRKTAQATPIVRTCEGLPLCRTQTHNGCKAGSSSKPRTLSSS
jgi:hypothetical protein